MERSRSTIVAVMGVIVALLFTAALVFAQGEGRGGHHGESTSQKEKSTEATSRGKGMMGGGMMEMMKGKGGMMGERMMCHHEGLEDKMERHFSLCLENAEKLGLTKDQVEKLKGIHNEQKKKLIRLKADIKVIGVDLSAELEKDVPDLEKVERYLEEQGKLKTKYRFELVKTRIESAKVLTPEQRKKLKGLMGEGREHMGEHMMMR